MADRKLKKVAFAIASGCYDELVEKDDITRSRYIGMYSHLFEKAAANAIAVIEGRGAVASLDRS